MTNQKILLNGHDNPKPADKIFVGVGDIIYANHLVENYGFTAGDLYEVMGMSKNGKNLIMINDSGEPDEYDTRCFQWEQPK